MANRSYLYTYHPGEPPEYRDFGEWNYDIPIAHLLFVGANPEICASQLWHTEAKIAIKGDANKSRPIFLAFLDWLAPQLSANFHKEAEDAKLLLLRKDRQSKYFHLELGEIYQLMDLRLDQVEAETKANASLAQNLFADVQRVIGQNGSSFHDFTHERLKNLKNNWEEQLGLFFSDVLYFHLGD